MAEHKKNKVPVIWLFVDGKPGHQNQSEGLVAAIADNIAIKVQRMPVLPFWKTLKGKLFHKNHLLNFAAKPDIAIGAGHATHASLLLTRLLFGAKTIVLMKPSLPVFVFDLCFVPEHDAVKESKKVILTRGVLNRVHAAEKKQINKGLLLIGGPSKHYAWHEADVLRQVETILAEMPHIQWHMTNSRRTPAETSKALAEMVSETVNYYPFDEVDSAWLAEMLADAHDAWVTEDSVSMVYEALTAGCRVGLISGERLMPGRVSRGIEDLVRKEWLMPFDHWQASGQMHDAVKGFNEAGRCAQQVVNRFLKPGVEA